MIPNLLHFVWVDSPLPDWAAENIERFRRMNHEMEIVVHTGSRSLHPHYERAWAAAEFPSVRADLLRYSVLEYLGGFYIDCDCRPLRPLREMPQLENLRACLLIAADADWDAAHTSVNNWFLAAEIGCAAWPIVRNYIVKKAPPHSPCDLAIGMLEVLCRRHATFFRPGEPTHFTGGVAADRDLYDNGPPADTTQFIAHYHRSAHGRTQP